MRTLESDVSRRRWSAASQIARDPRTPRGNLAREPVLPHVGWSTDECLVATVMVFASGPWTLVGTVPCAARCTPVWVLPGRPVIPPGGFAPGGPMQAANCLRPPLCLPSGLVGHFRAADGQFDVKAPLSSAFGLHAGLCLEDVSAPSSALAACSRTTLRCLGAFYSFAIPLHWCHSCGLLMVSLLMLAA